MENITKKLQLVLLSIILLSTVIAVGIEIKTMLINQSVTLADLLLMFLYLEVMAMVRIFWAQQSISITLPLLIAITALARFIILQGKETVSYTHLRAPRDVEESRMPSSA